MKVILLVFLLIGQLDACSQGKIFKLTHCKIPETLDSVSLSVLFIDAYNEHKLLKVDTLMTRDEMEQLSGERKTIPEELKDEALVALSYFPELAKSRIVIKYEKIRGTMNARPASWNIFRSKENRKYLIVMNNNKGKYKGLNFKDLSFDARIGWFGHELSHIYTYSQMTNVQTVGFTLRYIISNKYVRRVERFTNYIAIQHGLAFHIIEGERYLLANIKVSKKYKEITEYRSLSTLEIMCLWYSLMNAQLESSY